MANLQKGTCKIFHATNYLKLELLIGCIAGPVDCMDDRGVYKVLREKGIVNGNLEDSRYDGKISAEECKSAKGRADEAGSGSYALIYFGVSAKCCFVW